MGPLNKTKINKPLERALERIHKQKNQHWFWDHVNDDVRRHCGRIFHSIVDNLFVFVLQAVDMRRCLSFYRILYDQTDNESHNNNQQADRQQRNNVKNPSNRFWCATEKPADLPYRMRKPCAHSAYDFLACRLASIYSSHGANKSQKKERKTSTLHAWTLWIYSLLVHCSSSSTKQMAHEWAIFQQNVFVREREQHIIHHRRRCTHRIGLIVSARGKKGGSNESNGSFGGDHTLCAYKI